RDRRRVDPSLGARMTTTAAQFYRTGGTLPPETPSYVPRQADGDLFDALSRGEFCYVLTSRQMGKSSHHPLRGYPVRTAVRLKESSPRRGIRSYTGENHSPIPTKEVPHGALSGT